MKKSMSTNALANLTLSFNTNKKTRYLRRQRAYNKSNTMKNSILNSYYKNNENKLRVVKLMFNLLICN
jgi:hypothetical protein